MPDFRVIEGGGPGRPPGGQEAQQAINSFERMTAELMRALARGDDPQNRVANELEEFISQAGKLRQPPADLIRHAVRDMRTQLRGDADEPRFLKQIGRIVQASLRVAAEACSYDNAAAGRRSKRTRDLLGAIKILNEWRRERPQRASD